MANHITAIENKVLVLQYLNGVRTIIIGHGYNPKSVINSIIERIQKYKEQIASDIEEAVKEEDHVCGYVWHIDSDLNFNYNLSQCLIGPNDTIARSDVFHIPYPYDLGENEKTEDVQKYYPNYKYPYK